MEEVIIRQVTAKEPEVLERLIRLFSEVFDMEKFQLPSPQHLHRLLSREDFIVLVACENEQVMGGLTGYVLNQYYTEKPQVYLYDLAVAARYQRTGIGKRLLNALQNYCLDKGYELFFVQAEQAEAQAVNFYRKNQPTAELEVLQFTFNTDTQPG